MSSGEPVDREPPLLDVRTEVAFAAGHVAGAASIALEELGQRTHELPPASRTLRVIDSDPDRATVAAEFLRRRGHRVHIVPWKAQLATESGPPRAVLWRPNPFLVEALEVIGSNCDARSGLRAMDVACGSGRDAVYLALQGYNVLAVDLLPDALDRAADLARRNRVRLATLAMNVETGPALPPDMFDLVTVFRFLHRPLFPLLRRAVAPGGYIVYETFHQRNRKTGSRPNDPAHLLSTGELSAAFEGFDIRISRDGVERDGRFFSSLLARRPNA